jgi:hypothetical protein
VRVFGVWKTVVAFVSYMELVAHVDGVTTVWVTSDVLLSDVCVAACDGVTVIWVTFVVMLSYICVAAGDGVTVVWVTVVVVVSK